MPSMGSLTPPLVSIITPSFNQARFLGATLESVAAQNYPRLEHIVMDGASTDGSVEILRAFAETHPYVQWVSAPDGGQSDALNKGIRMARGEIIGWLNSDDLYCEGAVAAAVQALSAESSLDLVYGDAWLIDEVGRIRRPWDATEHFSFERLRGVKDYICQPAAFLRRRVFDEVGLIDPSLHWAMDWDLWIRIGQRGRVTRIPGFLACARDHADTKTAGGGMTRMREAMGIMRRYNNGRVPPAMLLHFGLGVLLDRVRWKLRAMPISRQLLRWNDARRARRFAKLARPPSALE